MGAELPSSLSRWITAAVLVLCCAELFYSFAANKTCLMLGLDGNWYLTILHQEALGRQPFSQLGVDALTGNFDAYYPLQREYLLPTALTMAVGGGIPSKVFFYDTYAVLLLLAVYACGRAIGFGRPIAVGAGFLMASFALPGMANSIANFYPLFQANVFWSQSVAAELLIVAALWTLNGRGLWRSAMLAAVPVLALMITVAGEAPHVLFIVPTIALYGGASLLDATRWRDNLARALAILAMIAVPLALGCLTYYYGIINYTAYRFFPGEITHPLGGWLALSTAFWTSPVGKPVIAMGIAGAIWAAVAGPRKLRLFALAHLGGSIAYFAIATWMAFYSTNYRGSWPVYFETGIWPIALLFAVFVAVKLVRAALLLPVRLLRRQTTYLGAVSGWGVVAIVIVCIAKINFAAAGAPSICTRTGWNPVASTPISEVLKNQISLVPGKPFEGLVVTIDDVPSGIPGDWIRFHDDDWKVWNATGNDHRTVGLWRYDIPTVFQYHSFITPPYHLLLTEFLSRPEDHQLRSQIVMSKFDPAYMRLIGIRYLIADEDVDFGQVVATVPVKDRPTLRLVELSDPNLGNYSPTAIFHADDFRSGIARMHAADFDGRNEVVTDSALSGPWVPATNVRLTYERYGLHLSADSAGNSLLVLPAQFSRCWQAQGEGEPRLFRADLMQLGVRFSGRLDAKLLFRLGPILAGSCRVEDFHDMERLRIREARPGAG
jgi:hypothetical protein